MDERLRFIYLGRYLSKHLSSKALELLKFYKIPIIVKIYGKTIQKILFANLDIPSIASLTSDCRKQFGISKEEVDILLDTTVKGDGECSECGGEYEIYDFKDDGDEFNPKITHLHKRCIVCNRLKREKL